MKSESKIREIRGHKPSELTGRSRPPSFDFKFRGRHFQFRAGLKVYNILNHFNPRDVQQYGDSRQFGIFYNSVGRLYRLEGEFDF
jgi:hypothetical protein